MSRLPEVNVLESSQIESYILLTEVAHSPVTSEEVKLHTRRDPIMSQALNFVQNGWPDAVVDDQFQSYYCRRGEFSVQDGCLIWGNRVVIPPLLRDKVLEELHVAHPVVCRMKALARCHVWWPNMDKEIEFKVIQCETCQMNQNMPASAPVDPWENTSKPWTRIHIDYAGPFMGHMFLIIVDSYSKWIDAYPMKTSVSQTTIERLRNTFATHGLSEICGSDNAFCFTSEEFEVFMKKNGIRHVTSAPYHPATNGCAEGAVQTFKAALKKMKCSGGETIMTLVNRFLFHCRITPATMTGQSPAELLMGRQLKSVISLLKPHWNRRLHSHHEKSIKQSGAKVVRNLCIGEPVWVRNYGAGAKWVQGVTVKQTGPVSYHVQTDSHGLLRKHVDQIQTRMELARHCTKQRQYGKSACTTYSANRRDSTTRSGSGNAKGRSF